MQPITLHTRIDEHHQIIIDVPKDVPIGEVEVTIRPVAVPAEELSREEIRARLKAADLWVDPAELDEDSEGDILSDEELKRISLLLAKGKTLQEMIDEERGE